METRKIVVNGEEIEIATKIDDDIRENNNVYSCDHDDTLDLSEVVEIVNKEDSGNYE